MKKLLVSLLPALALSLAAPAAGAGENAVLVELFTSQGCSSCPPADRNLAALADREDVIALSLHVDYWDYLGWRDTFGRAEHTQRQFAYRDLMGNRVVYTPQMIVNGVRDVPGYRSKLLETAIAEALGETPRAALEIVAEGGMLKAVLDAASAPERCTVWIASYDRQEKVTIRRGENAGKTITYHNVVTKLMRVGTWDGTTQQIALPQPGAGEGIAVWLQDDRTGQVLAARFVEE